MKKPLCNNQQGKNSEQKLLQTAAPASTLSSSAHSSSACLLQKRAGLKGYFANSEP